MAGIRRRDFIAAAGSTAVAWPLAVARAAAGDAGDRISRQRHRPSRICPGDGGISSGARPGFGLREGQNVTLEQRWANNAL